MLGAGLAQAPCCPSCPARSATGLESWETKGVPRGRAGRKDACPGRCPPPCSAEGAPARGARPCCVTPRGCSGAEPEGAFCLGAGWWRHGAFGGLGFAEPGAICRFPEQRPAAQSADGMQSHRWGVARAPGATAPQLAPQPPGPPQVHCAHALGGVCDPCEFSPRWDAPREWRPLYQQKGLPTSHATDHVSLFLLWQSYSD